MKILLEAPILSLSGYGEHSRLVYKSLSDSGHEIYINPLPWGSTSWDDSIIPISAHSAIASFSEYLRMVQSTGSKMQFDIQVHVGIPSEFEKKAPYSVCVTAGIETDRVSPEWIYRTHKGIDKLIVPSKHSAKGFTDTSYQISTHEGQPTVLSLNSPIEVVPYPVKKVKPAELKLELETEFNFLSIALLGPRKNIESSIFWFLKEFKDEENVGLILKTGIGKTSLLDRTATRQHLNHILSQSPESKCKVYLLHGNMTEEEIHGLYVHPKINAYLSITHGEGYGLPIFEAAYSGLPIVATDWSAHTEFLSGDIRESGKVKNKKLFAKVEYKLEKVSPSAVWKDIITSESLWAYPTEISYRSQIRKVYKNHGMYKKWAMALKEQIIRNYEESIVLSQMKNSILSRSTDQVPHSPTEDFEDDVVIL